jgi:hypothetical protein
MDEHATVVKLEFADDTLEFRTPSKNIQKWRGRPVHSEKEVAEAR